MAFQLNQFKLTNQEGIVMNVNPNTIAVRAISTLSGTLKAGDAVKIATTEAGDLPVVDKAASADQVDGIVIFNQKKATYAALDVFEIALTSSIITMVAGGALNRRQAVSWNSVTGKLQTTTTNYLGITLDIASNSGDIVRVLVNPKII